MPPAVHTKPETDLVVGNSTNKKMTSESLHPIEASQLHARRERVFLILAGLFLGSMTMLNILGISRFICLYDTPSRSCVPTLSVSSTDADEPIGWCGLAYCLTSGWCLFCGWAGRCPGSKIWIPVSLLTLTGRRRCSFKLEASHLPRSARRWRLIWQLSSATFICFIF